MMILCKTDSGLKFGCKWKGIGGVSKVYMMPFEYIQGYTYNDLNQISFIGQIGSNKYFDFEQILQTAIVSQKYIKDDKTGLYYFEQKLEIQFNKPTYILTNQMIKMLNTRLFSVIILDNNGRYFLQGKTYGMYIENEDETTGQKYENWNGQKIVLLAKEPERRIEVLSTAFTISAARTSSGLPTGTEIGTIGDEQG